MMSGAKQRVPKRRFKEFLNAGDWEQRKLGDLAEIVRGASPRPISDPKWFDNDSSVGWLRIADVTAQDGRIRYLEQKISELGQEKTRVIKTPHLLLSIAATVGKPVINYVPTGVHDGFLIFLNPKFNILYTFWWLEMFREKWNKYGQPGSQVNLNSDLVKNQVINIPNEKEQDKISSFLESLDKIITLHQRKLDKLQATKKALLQEMFPEEGQDKPKRRFKGFTDAWEQRKLIDIAKTFIGLVTTMTENYRDSGTLLIRNSDIKEGQFVFSEEPIHLDEEFAEKNKTRRLQIGDVVTVHTGDIGTSAVIQEKEDGAIGFATINTRTDKRILNPYFLSTYFNTEKHKCYANSVSTGDGRSNYNIKDFNKLVISIPTLDEQEKISVLINNINTIITLHQRKLDKLKNLKQAYLNEMFV